MGRQGIRERRRARGGALVTPRFRGVNCRGAKVRRGSDLLAPRQHARAPVRPWTRRRRQFVNDFFFFFRGGRATRRRREVAGNVGGGRRTVAPSITI